LTTQYRGEAYDFWDDVLFAYLNIPGGDALDRVELPGWVLRDDQAEYVFDVVRAEAGVGRGYPEILQQADANAVLDTGAKPVPRARTGVRGRTRPPDRVGRESPLEGTSPPITRRHNS